MHVIAGTARRTICSSHDPVLEVQLHLCQDEGAVLLTARQDEATASMAVCHITSMHINSINTSGPYCPCTALDVLRALCTKYKNEKKISYTPDHSNPTTIIRNAIMHSRA